MNMFEQFIIRPIQMVAGAGAAAVWLFGSASSGRALAPIDIPKTNKTRRWLARERVGV